jgi:CBS domain containing-hemolysin-like protein
MDDFMAELISLRNELNAIGNNFNQVVKKLHLLQSHPEFKTWFLINETLQLCLIKKVEEQHYSRLPVYKEDLDNVVGMIHTKDLLPYLEQPQDFEWHTLMRPPYFIHEQKMIEDLLKEFQTKRTHFAIVVDEFGGTSGIVTLEDILEEIIGDIKDEFDDEDIYFKKLDDNNYLFEGKIIIHDVCKAMELPMETFDDVKGDNETLAGLVLELAGEIPAVDETISSGDFSFTVLEIEKNRLQKIKVAIKPTNTE